MDFTVGSALSFGWKTFKKRPWLFVSAGVVFVFATLVIEAIIYGVDGAFVERQPFADGGAADYGALLGLLIRVLFSYALYAFLYICVMAFCLAAYDNPETVELSVLHPRPLWKALGALILLGLMIPLAIVLSFVFLVPLVLIVGEFVPQGAWWYFLSLVLVLIYTPAITAVLLFMFAPLIAIDRQFSSLAALKESMRIGRGHRWKLLGLIVLLYLLMLVPVLLLAILVQGLVLSIIDQVFVLTINNATEVADFAFDLTLLLVPLVTMPMATLAFVHAYRVLSAKAGLAPAATDARLST